MAFTARYHGVCAACEKHIHEGDQVKYDAENQVVHDDCYLHTSAPVEYPVCQVCWLTHPEGVCDRG